ncbi:MAG: Mrp/NBP35 family ATP-binding protein [Coriobacteriaceae bacterium]|nr:Mrp/NBP35 family ATP-binding protein [Coriobacteriaceae bacterium]MDD7112081.1 Mrp/NBP35 family ATP-binding protein [Coriobacteriaceae bacterium]
MAENVPADGNVMRAGDTSKLAQNDMSSVKHVIGVVSGKGGVGKSLVSGLIAADAARKGLKVGILDADITGPTIPHMFGFNHVGITAQNNLLVPARTKEGIEVMSINLLLRNPDDPVIWRGPVIGGCVKQFWNEVVWGDLDVLVVDMPPGTGDVALTVFQSIPVDGVVIVASPQDLVATIVGKAVNMAKSMDVPVLGLVENMSYFECPDCGKKHYIFGDSHIDEVAEKYGVDVLARLPMNPDFAAMCDEGKVMDIPNPGIDAEKLLDKAASVKIASSLMGGWTVAE